MIKMIKMVRQIHLKENTLSTSIVLPSEISSSIAKTAVNARSRFYMNAFLYSKFRYKSVQGSEVEEAKGHQMVMLKEVI